MDAKAYLSQALWLDQSIHNKLEHLERLESLVQKVTGDFIKGKISGVERNRNPTDTGEPMVDTTVRIIDLAHEINCDIDKLIDLKRKMIETIGQVGDASYRLLLEMRYINGKSWDDVARYMGYDRSTIFRIHGKALKEIERMISCEKELKISSL